MARPQQNPLGTELMLSAWPSLQARHCPMVWQRRSGVSQVRRLASWVQSSSEPEISTPESFRELVFAPEYFVARHDKRQLVGLRVRLQRFDTPARIGKRFVLQLALLQ